MKHYLDIERCKQKYAETFEVGEHIIIEEKVDCSNASILYNSETNSLEAFSRRQKLSPQNTLNGFWNYVMQLNVEPFKEVLGERFILFGEWTGMKHSIQYPKDVYNKFWMFDVWDKETEQYLPYTAAADIFNRLVTYGLDRLCFVPVFYDGKFESLEHVLSYVGRTDIGGSPSGEGIVIKRQDRLNYKNSNIPYYVKIVAEKFSEVHGSKKQTTVDPEALAKKEAEKELISTIVTPQRVQKLLFKFIEDGVIPQDWDEHNMKDISKIIPRAVYNDCIKEENEIVIQCENFGKISASLAMSHVRNLLNNR